MARTATPTDDGRTADDTTSMTADEVYRDHVARQPVVGVDAEGATHRFDSYTDTVYVISADGSVDHVEQLDPGQLPGWVHYVADKRGWDDLRYSDEAPMAALVSALADGLAE